MVYPKIPLAQSLIEIFRQKNIKHIVISPGSRNAPLTIGFASHPDFTCYSVADERVAGFFALGIAQQLQEPVAVVCTSGSALLNYYPALAEAFYSQIPFVVVSADRPLSKIDIGDGQTIRQQNVFENHILYNANLDENASAANDKLICEALDTAKLKKGPVHINIPFEEPLYETVSELSVTPIITKIEDENNAIVDYSNFSKIWNSSQKKLVLVGTNYPNKLDKQIVELLANDPSVVVMTETTSNLHHPNFVDKIDVLITSFSEDDFKNLQPDLLISFGGMVVSKRIKAFLRKYKPLHHWHIDTLRAYDTFGALTAHIKERPNTFLKNIYIDNIILKSDYNASVQEIKSEKKVKSNNYIQSVAYSDLFVFGKIVASLPDDIQLQISNSSAIRYLQLFDSNPTIDVFCNRGTSGIDGSTSTAVGAAVVSDKPVVLISGDVGFFYDSNGLWNNHISDNFKIILINNSGGGIFRILPGHQNNDIFSTYFETQHNLTAEHLAKMYDFKYFLAQNKLETEIGLEKFLKCTTKCILEIKTPTTVNDEVLKEFFKKIK